MNTLVSRAGVAVLAVLGVWIVTTAPIPVSGSQSPAPSRIISIVPAVTEMLFAIGAGPQVIGVSSFDTFPPEVSTRTKVGALVDPDFERILSLKPDLVVVYGTQAELIGRLGRVGIPTFDYQHAGLGDITTTLTAVGTRVGRATEASLRARDIQRDLDDVRQSVAGRRRPRVALVFGREPGTLRNMFVSGGTGFLHDLIVTAGGDNAFANVNRQNLQVSSEVMLARAPEVVIETHPSDWTGDPGRERAVWRGLPALPAVRANRIHIVADDRLFIPGPRVADAARLLAGLIHAEPPPGK